MGDNQTEIEFIDNGNAPEFFANGLHDVEVMGPVSRFVLRVLRRTPAGVLYYEPPLTCIMPNEDIAPAIALTLRKLAGSVIVPMAVKAARRIGIH